MSAWRCHVGMVTDGGDASIIYQDSPAPPGGGTRADARIRKLKRLAHGQETAAAYAAFVFAASRYRLRRLPASFSYSASLPASSNTRLLRLIKCRLNENSDLESIPLKDSNDLRQRPGMNGYINRCAINMEASFPASLCRCYRVHVGDKHPSPRLDDTSTLESKCLQILDVAQQEGSNDQGVRGIFAWQRRTVAMFELGCRKGPFRERAFSIILEQSMPMSEAG